MAPRITFVYVHLSGGPAPAGRLEMIEEGRNSYAIFEYGTRYLQRPNRVPVDPAALPLPDGAGVQFQTAQGFEVFNGIRDAAPDGWGRYLMRKAAGAANLGEFDILIASGDDRVGALAFGPDPTSGPKRIVPWADGDLPGENLDLAAVSEAIDRAQTVDELTPDLKRILGAGASLGGARPKVAAAHRGAPWIAKFSAKGDTYPVCRTELAVMRLARQCGLDVPELDFMTILNRDIYLIQRFDRVSDGHQLRRAPYASALTMLEALEIAAHEYSYKDLANTVRRFGSDPNTDLPELFRRMAFNILVGNDDDHLRNHAFLLDQRGWRLSPLYDVVPRPRIGSEGSLVLEVGDRGHQATLANALTSAPAFGLAPDEAAALLEDLRLQVDAGWKPALTKAGVGSTDIERLAKSFSEARNDQWRR
jgi:serine/threonine-protein kinase HipA